MGSILQVAGSAITDSDRASILIVDDRPDKLLVFRTILEELDQNIVTLQSGEEALRWLLDNECAVLLLDVNMPGMDGFETAEMVRARRRSAHTPIIFITSHVDEIHSTRGYALGAVDFLLAPVMPNVLRSKVAVFVQLFNLTRQIRQRADEHISLVREQTARTAAEEASRRAHFLADAGKVFISSLDLRALLGGTTRLAVPFLADFSALTVIHGDRQIDSATSADDWRLRGSAHPLTEDPAWHAAVRDVMETGTERVVDDLSLAPVPASQPDAGPGAAAAPTRALLLPLCARGQTHGVLALVTSPPRGEEDPDATLARDLAARAATAIDNCLLYKEVQEIDTRKNEFLATLSHELRNPLAPIRTAIHTLHLSGQWPAGSDALRHMLERQLEHLTRLVDDLLDVSRITHGKIRLRRESVNLVAKVRYALENCRVPLDESGHEVTVRLPEQPVLVDGDRVRIQQIFENLILNACRYTERGGRIDISLTAHEGEAIFSIRDSGIGISAEMMPRLFDMFAQGEAAADRTRHGLGIGLALVRNLVRLHGGAIHATSEGEGKGSEFTVRLPLTAAVPLTPPESTVTQSSLTMETAMDELRILVVDDNTDAAESLKMLLSVFGHQVEIAHDGTSALAVARSHSPQVVFLDIGLPGMDGYEVARRFRSDEGLARSKLIALSGYGTENDQQRSRAAGFNRHLVKPVDPSELPAIIAQVTGAP